MEGAKIKYKLITPDGYTRKGLSGETYWLDSLEKVAAGKDKDTDLCTDNVIHYYQHPVLAVLFNSCHARIKNPRLIKIKIDKEWVFDGLKGGCKKAKFVEEIKLPKVSLEQRIIFAIKISRIYYKDKKYRKWAKNWLSGKDRTHDAADAVAYAASAAAAKVVANNAVADYDITHAAYAATYAAYAATYAAADYAAYVAADYDKAAVYAKAAAKATALAANYVAHIAHTPADNLSGVASATTLNKLFLEIVRRELVCGDFLLC